MATSPNPYDQFDAAANPYDQFDAPMAPAAPAASSPAPQQSPDALGPWASALVRPIIKGVSALPMMAAETGVEMRNLMTNVSNGVYPTLADFNPFAKNGGTPSPYERPMPQFDKALDYYTQAPQGFFPKAAEAVSAGLVGAGLPSPTVAGPPASFVADSQQALRDASLQNAQRAGYVVPPSANNPSFWNRVLEGIAGKSKVAQEAKDINEGVTQRLASASIGQGAEAPLTRDALDAIRSQAGASGYEPLRQLGNIQTDSQFLDDIDAATRSATAANRSFPGISPKNDLTDTADALTQDSFNSSDALNAISVLRDKAKDAYGAGNASLGKGYRQLSGALEDQIERHLEAQGPQGADILAAYRNARTLMAKTYTVGGALSDEAGTINALKFGQDLAKGKPLTGDQRAIADFARNFRDFAGRAPGSNPSISPVDVYGAIGAAGLSHNPLPLMIPFARIGAKNYLLSGAGQARAFAPYAAPTMMGLPGAFPTSSYLFDNNPSAPQ